MLVKLIFTFIFIFSIYCAQQEPLEKKSLLKISGAAIAEENDREMQDCHKVSTAKDSYFFGVFDGHGKDGREIAKYIADNLDRNIYKNFEYCNKNVEWAIEDEFNKINDHFKQHDRSGSTASIVIIENNIIYISWVGDSSILLGQKNETEGLYTQDHRITLDNPEYNRIKALISEHRVDDELKVLIPRSDKNFRLGSIQHNSKTGLGLSRGFGDFLFKPFFISQPQIVKFDIENINFVVMASDGLWDVLNHNSVHAFVKKLIDKHSCRVILNLLMKHAINEWKRFNRSDNITIILIKFEKNNIYDFEIVV